MIIFSGTDAKRILALLEANIRELVYPGVALDDVAKIRGHFQVLGQRAEAGQQLDCTCRLETFPSTETTQITISASFRRAS